jgi:hypothetical protein
MTEHPCQTEFSFVEAPPDPPKKKAPARTVNADAGNGIQKCNGNLTSTKRRIKAKASEEPQTDPQVASQTSLDEFDFFGEKSPSSGSLAEKAPSVAGEKASSVGSGKTPSDYQPWVLLGVVDEAELKALLCRNSQQEWTYRKRITGLMMLIDYFVRKGPGNARSPGASMSCGLSREYVSSLKRPKKTTTIGQPLPLLVKIGILEVARKAVVAPHRKTAARYRIHSNRGKPKKFEVMLSAQQRDKIQNAGRRNEKRLNRKHPFRRQLLADLATVGLSNEGRNLALSMMTKGQKVPNIKSLMAYIDQMKPPKVSVDPCGTVHSFAKSTPRELKPHLTIHGNPVAICDIESAHMRVLPCVIQERIDWLAKRGMRTEKLEQERQNLISLLDSTDIYVHLAEGRDREKFKYSLLSTINMPTAKAVHVEAYQRFRRAFPLAVGIIEDIKKKGHHGISRPLQHHTARIIRLAMAESQKNGIPCIPDTDALIVPASAEDAVAEILNRALLQVTGVTSRRVRNAAGWGIAPLSE